VLVRVWRGLLLARLLARAFSFRRDGGSCIVAKIRITGLSMEEYDSPLWWTSSSGWY
jgi:hypothetical protein